MHTMHTQFCNSSALTLRYLFRSIIFVLMHSTSYSRVINFSCNSLNHYSSTGTSASTVVCSIALVAGIHIASVVADIVSCSSATLRVARVNYSSTLSTSTHTAVSTSA